ncbi:hypothetical protein FQZ97_1008980 [compost metagenome]
MTVGVVFGARDAAERIGNADLAPRRVVVSDRGVARSQRVALNLCQVDGLERAARSVGVLQLPTLVQRPLAIALRELDAARVNGAGQSADAVVDIARDCRLWLTEGRGLTDTQSSRVVAIGRDLQRAPGCG